MAQYVSASFAGRDYYMNAWVKADVTGMEMVLLNELGANMGELLYRNGAVHFSSMVFPQSLKPEYIVADFQLCFYDPLLLKAALKKCGLVLEAGEGKRSIYRGKSLLIEIEETADMVKLINHLRGYSYSLKGDFGAS